MLKPFLNKKLVEAGCDEAGRGCLAGPVFAAAVILPKNFKNNLLNDKNFRKIPPHYTYHKFIDKCINLIKFIKEFNKYLIDEELITNNYFINNINNINNNHDDYNKLKDTELSELKIFLTTILDDEKNNIKWSNYLEENGVTVLFGVQNLKVHS